VLYNNWRQRTGMNLNKAARLQAIGQQIQSVGKFTGKYEELYEWCNSYSLAVEMCLALNPKTDSEEEKEVERDAKYCWLSEQMFKNTIISNLRALMTIDTKSWFERWVESKINEGVIGDISTLVNDIKLKFIEKEKTEIRKKWFNCKQEGENIDTYGLRIVKLAKILKIDDQQMVIFHFINTLDSEELKAKLMSKQFANIESAVDKAIKYNTDSKFITRPVINTISKEKCKVCGKTNHNTNQCWNAKKKFTKRNNNNNNNNLNEIPSNNKSNSVAKGRNEGNHRKVKCYKCKKVGHIAKDCRNINLITGDREKLKQVEVTIKNYVIYPLLDSGSESELVRIDLLKSLNLEKDIVWNNSSAQGVGGLLNLLGTISLDINIAGIIKTLKFDVVDEKFQYVMLIGIQGLSSMGISWDFNNNIISMNDIQIQLDDVDYKYINNQIREIQLIMKYKSIFTEPTFNEKIPHAKVDPHVIRVVDNIPCSDPRRPHLSLKSQAFLNEMNEKYIKCGWLEPAEDSMYACNPVVIWKGQKGRYTCNFGPINNKIMDDPYPLRRIDDLLQDVEGMKFISIVDLDKGYFQIPLSEESKKYMTIRTPSHGLLQWKVLAMGEKTAPARFQRTMDKVIAEIHPSSLSKDCIVKAYIDDIIICTKIDDPIIHQKDIEVVLKSFQKRKLRVNMKKCKLFRSKINYLGHQISTEGIQPIDHKLTKMIKIPYPNNKTEVKRILGTINEYRKFLPNIAHSCEPLHNLLRDNSDIQFNDQIVRDAIDAIRKKLSEAPILKLINKKSSMFIIESDASNYAIGGVLKQVVDNTEQCCMYYSRTLQEAERRYDTSNKEMLASIESFKFFLPWIHGGKVTIRTDHKPNISYTKKRIEEMNGRQLRWLDIINENDLKFEYRPGSKMTIPDILSRQINVITKYKSPIEWRKSQLNDEKLRIIIQKLEGKLELSLKNVKLNIDNYKMINGILYKEVYNKNFSTICDTPIDVIVVPRSMTKFVIEMAHTEMPYGHLGIAATSWIIKRNFYWNSMVQDIKAYIKKCEECQYTKNLKITPGVMLPIQQKVTRPFQLIGIDIAGPLPKTKKHNRFFLLMVDYYTGWVECEPIKDIESNTIINKIMKKWIYRFGVPEGIITDNGSSFMSQLAMKFYEKLNITKRTTSVYHPQSDGKAERTIGTIKNIIKKNIIKSDEEWDTLLELACFAIRSCGKVSSNRPSPSEALFGFKIRTPIDMYNEFNTNDLTPIQEKRKEIWITIIKQVEEYVRKYEYYNNLNRKQMSINVGDLVLLKRPRKSGLQSTYEGPFKIKKVIGPNTVTLENIDGTQLRSRSTVNIERIKPYYAQNVEDPKMNDNELGEYEIVNDPFPNIIVNSNLNEMDIIAMESLNNIMNNDYNEIYDADTESEDEDDDDNENYNNINEITINDEDNNLIQDNTNIIENNDDNHENNEENTNVAWIRPEKIKRSNIADELNRHNIQVSKKATFYDKLLQYELAYKERGE
jgi:hypothetical protein